MNFKKEQLEEVMTANKITDIVVFEKGSSVPKKISKSTFDTLYEPTLVYKATATQSGTNPPEVTVLLNTLGEDLTVTYNGQGNYSLVSASGLFLENKTVCLIGQYASQLNSLYRINDTTIRITSEDLSGGTPFADNGLLLEASIYIEINN